VAETVLAMDALIRQGKVLYWGTSEWPAELIVQAHAFAAENGLYPPAMEQPQYNLLHRERVEVEYADLYARYGMGTTTWSPLASGVLTGKYNDSIPAESRLAQKGNDWLRRSVLDPQSNRLQRARAFTAIAAELRIPPATLAIAWCLGNPHVTSVLLGATRLEQLLQNLDALEAGGRIDAETWARIEAVTR
jgi:aryl-alcohol dehydrogenase-like predicted oxidoreductase